MQVICSAFDAVQVASFCFYNAIDLGVQHCAMGFCEGWLAVFGCEDDVVKHL
jgi:hypothetical protein